MLRLIFSLCCCVAAASCSLSHAEDWPQWMGANRDGLWSESEVVTQIAAGQSLPVRWRIKIGGGYSGPAVSAGRVLVTDYTARNAELKNNPGSRDSRDGIERVLCVDHQSGKTVWQHEYARPYKISYAAGPRATPTVDQDRVYLLGAEGDLLCLRLADGQVVWQQNLAQAYKAETPLWGHSAHPLVHGDLLYCLAGGQGSVVVALDKLTGKEVWRALSASEIGYCPPSIVSIGEQQQLVVWHPEAVCGLDLQSGKTLWTYPLAPQYEMSIGAPRFQGNRMFASGIGDTAALVEFDVNRQPTKTVWKGLPKQCVFSANATALWIDHAIYGADCQSGQFVAVDPENGKRLWETFELTTGVPGRRASHGTAFMVHNSNNGHAYIFAETGELIIAKLSRAGFEVRGRMKVVEPTGECFGRAVVWSHPAFAQRTMIVRNDQEMVCVDLSVPAR